MLDVSPKNLNAEFDAALRATEAECKPVDKQVARYVGTVETVGSGEDAYDDYDPQNHAYKFISLNLAANVHGDPEFACSSRKGEEEAEDAKAMGLALTRWAKDVDLRGRMRQCYVDYCFKRAVGILEREPVPGCDEGPQTSVPKRPVFRRLSMKRYVRDTMALADDECRFKGHEWIRDQEDLVSAATDDPDAGWILAAIQRLATGVGEMRKDKPNDVPDRKEVRGRDVWVPEYELPADDPGWLGIPKKYRKKMFHGTIFTIGVSAKDSDFIRRPRPFFGPRWGPYYVAEYLYVPDRTNGLSHFEAVEGAVRTSNVVKRAIRNSVEKRKNIGIVSAKDAAAAPLLTAAEDGSIVVADVDDVRTAVAALAVGGTDEQVLRFDQMCDAELRETSGLTETKAGNVNPNATATADAIADAGDSARSAGSREEFYDFVADVATGAAWYIHYDDEYEAPMGDGSTIYGGPPSSQGDKVRAAVAEIVDPETAGPLPPELQAELVKRATDDKPWEKRNFDDLEFSIVPMTMEHPNQGANQRTVMALAPLVVQTIQVAAVAPQFKAAKFLAWLGKPFGMERELGELLDEKAATAMQQIAVAGQIAQAAPPEETKPPPRMAQDVAPKAASGPSTGAKAGGAAKAGKPMATTTASGSGTS